MRLLLIFVGLFFGTFYAAAQSSVPTNVPLNLDQIALQSVGDYQNHCLENLTVSQCSLIKVSGAEYTSESSWIGENISKLCLFHFISMESENCIEPAAHKQPPIFTRRLVALQPFSIKKPPRLTS
tara:strand:+ start:407 stop:781 length:375 start_codon:yes stop_codon:yes gene_type:complete